MSEARFVRRLAALVVMAMVIIHGSPGRAADAPVVTITEVGPDQDIPVGSSYYLTGVLDAKVTEVQVVFVRIGTRTLFGTTGGSCTEFSSHLGTKFKGAKGPSDTIDVATLGTTTASAVWAGDGTLFDGSAPTFLAAKWTRGAADNGKDGVSYKTLIPSHSFFSSSGAYCLYVYKKKTESVSSNEAVAKALFDFGDSAKLCGGALVCLAAAQVKREDALKAAGETLDPAAFTKLQDAANAELNPAMDISASANALQGLFAIWKTANDSTRGPSFLKPFDFGAAADVSVDPLARALVSLLAKNNGLWPTVNAGKVSFFTTGGKVEIKLIEVLEDGSTLRVAQDAAKGQRAILEIKTDALKIDELDVTVRDLLELTRGRLRIGDGYVTVAALHQTLTPILEEHRTALSDGDKKVLEGAMNRIRALADGVQRVLAVDANPANATAAMGTLIGGERDLGMWIKTKLQPCAAPFMCAVPGQTPPPPKEAWPGFGTATDNQLQAVAANLEIFKLARDRWAAKSEALKVTLEKTTTAATTPIMITVHFTQDQWVFSYVTPIVGVGFVVSGRDSFTLPVVGVQIHLVPNPVDDPLWTKPNDILRSFALELGMSTKTGPFGPENRFSGWKGLPPVFAGLALHPLPYTTGSVGMSFLQRQSSTLALEKPSAWVSLYFGLNVQMNIPDIVVALKGRHTTSTASAP